ncbi:MAG: nucleoside deaminase [Planctomycetota bacterium]|jgi:tRNA(Arg) A34 adenosine deaminase TadA
MGPEELMMRAVQLSIEKMQQGLGGPFGAVIARDGEILAEGWNQVTSSNDPTAHAEVIAIRRACEKLGTFDLTGSEIYSSCEPCPMCLSAILWARLDRLCYSNTREQAAAAGFDDARFYEETRRPAGERGLPTVRLPLAEAERALEIWKGRDDKISY